MPAYDIYHNEVRHALEKDGWTITHDPYVLKYEEVRVQADLGAERLFAAERDSQKIVVEVKSFIKPSPIQDVKEALGQYNMYSVYLEEVDPERRIYIAIRREIYERIFTQKAVQVLVQRFQMPLIIVDVEKEEIVSWTK